MKFDSGTMIQNPAEGAPVFKALEDAGFDGAYTWEGAHDPFLPLVSAAMSTEKIELLTSIAVAFSRNPMNLANIAYDLNLLSKGRFILGLGSQIRPHITKRFSMPWSKPAARMEDNVPEKTKQRRLSEIIEKQQSHSLFHMQQKIGQTLEVLIEGVSKKSNKHFYGRTTYNSTVVFKKGKHKPGEYVMVKIENCTSATLIGKAI